MPSIKDWPAALPMGGDATFDCAGVTDGDEVGGLRGDCNSALAMFCTANAGDLGAMGTRALGSTTDCVGLASALYEVYISTLGTGD